MASWNGSFYTYSRLASNHSFPNTNKPCPRTITLEQVLLRDKARFMLEINTSSVASSIIGIRTMASKELGSFNWRLKIPYRKIELCTINSQSQFGKYFITVKSMSFVNSMNGSWVFPTKAAFVECVWIKEDICLTQSGKYVPAQILGKKRKSFNK